jgi:hypothetical protein
VTGGCWRFCDLLSAQAADAANSQLRHCLIGRFFICQHPEVEARIVEELRGLGLLPTPKQPRPRVLEHADLGKLTYLTCAVKVRQSAGASADR